DPDVRARIRRDVEAPTTGPGLLDRIGWENIMVASCTRRKDAEGQRISELAASRGMDAFDAALELIIAEGGKGSMILFQLDERDLRRALAHPAVMIGSDGSALAPYGELATGKPHPRSYGTFPRVLGEYAREERVLTLPQAGHKMTALPARRLGRCARVPAAVSGAHRRHCRRQTRTCCAPALADDGRHDAGPRHATHAHRAAGCVPEPARGVAEDAARRAGRARRRTGPTRSNRGPDCGDGAGGLPA